MTPTLDSLHSHPRRSCRLTSKLPATCAATLKCVARKPTHPPCNAFSLPATSAQRALDAIRPRPAGPPSQQALADAEQIRALQQRVQELELAVQEAQVREEVALILSQRGEGEVEPAKKGQRPSVNLRKQKPR